MIVTWGIGHMYNPPTLNIPLNCLDLINRKENIVPDGVILICPNKEVAWQEHTSLLPQDDHWDSRPYLLYIFRCNDGILY